MNQEILSVLDEHEPLSVEEIADVIDAHPIQVDRHCYQLFQRGYIRIFSGGVYSLTEEGEYHLIQILDERLPVDVVEEIG